MAGKKKADGELDLESALEKLELLVESLEQGDKKNKTRQTINHIKNNI